MALVANRIPKAFEVPLPPRSEDSVSSAVEQRFSTRPNLLCRARRESFAVFDEIFKMSRFGKFDIRTIVRFGHDSRTDSDGPVIAVHAPVAARNSPDEIAFNVAVSVGRPSAARASKLASLAPHSFSTTAFSMRTSPHLAGRSPLSPLSPPHRSSQQRRTSGEAVPQPCSVSTREADLGPESTGQDANQRVPSVRVASVDHEIVETASSPRPLNPTEPSYPPRLRGLPLGGKPSRKNITIAPFIGRVSPGALDSGVRKWWRRFYDQLIEAQVFDDHRRTSMQHGSVLSGSLTDLAADLFIHAKDHEPTMPIETAGRLLVSQCSSPLSENTLQRTLIDTRKRRVETYAVLEGDAVSSSTARSPTSFLQNMLLVSSTLPTHCLVVRWMPPTRQAVYSFAEHAHPKYEQDLKRPARKQVAKGARARDVLSVVVNEIVQLAKNNGQVDPARPVPLKTSKVASSGSGDRPRTSFWILPHLGVRHTDGYIEVDHHIRPTTPDDSPVEDDSESAVQQHYRNLLATADDSEEVTDAEKDVAISSEALEEDSSTSEPTAHGGEEVQKANGAPGHASMTQTIPARAPDDSLGVPEQTFIATMCDKPKVPDSVFMYTEALATMPTTHAQAEVKKKQTRPRSKPPKAKPPWPTTQNNKSSAHWLIYLYKGQEHRVPEAPIVPGNRIWYVAEDSRLGFDVGRDAIDDSSSLSRPKPQTKMTTAVLHDYMETERGQFGWKSQNRWIITDYDSLKTTLMAAITFTSCPGSAQAAPDDSDAGTNTMFTGSTNSSACHGAVAENRTDDSAAAEDSAADDPGCGVTLRVVGSDRYSFKIGTFVEPRQAKLAKPVRERWTPRTLKQTQGAPRRSPDNGSHSGGGSCGVEKCSRDRAGDDDSSTVPSQERAVAALIGACPESSVAFQRPFESSVTPPRRRESAEESFSSQPRKGDTGACSERPAAQGKPGRQDRNAAVHGCRNPTSTAFDRRGGGFGSRLDFVHRRAAAPPPIGNSSSDKAVLTIHSDSRNTVAMVATRDQALTRRHLAALSTSNKKSEKQHGACSSAYELYDTKIYWLGARGTSCKRAKAHARNCMNAGSEQGHKKNRRSEVS
ncbi:hypothetical protein ON010_g9423 [Phytophthora cinnamomi]|nr:hypothetical protein ON010_g9423 [Phytophthora cinnamomi]